MQTISNFLSVDHKRCDAAFAAAEEAATRRDWDSAGKDFEGFHRAMEQHFAMEEQVLFPTFEESSGSMMGPTRVMRMEHEQMRELFRDMTEALARRDEEAYLGLSETLLIMMQQHNLKEEQILYPMTDQVLAPQRDEVLARMGEVQTRGDAT